MGGSDRVWLLCRVFFGATLMLGCAQGGSDPDGSGIPRRDGAVPPRRDGAVVRDGGGPGVPCEDEGHAAVCEMATDLGMLMPGDMMMPEPGVLPARDDADWFRVRFPSLAMPGMSGGGTPRVELATNEGMQFRFEIRATCSSTFACGSMDGPARDLGEWSFTDDPATSKMGEGQFSTRDVPWPEDIYIRVYRPTAPASCDEYQLRVSR